MLKRVSTSRSERGDTIVEVLICILIISMILAGAFMATNRSLQAVRDAQERSQASKIAETQLELIRSGAVPGATDFCFMADGSVVATVATDKLCHFLKDGSYKEAEGDPSPSGPAQGLYSSSEGVLYKTVVSRPAGANQPYQVQIQWITMKGQLGQLKMYYKGVL